MDRSAALAVLYEFTQSESLRKHALAVEACVAAYARKFGEDEKKWSVTAILHDFDYELHPNAPDHPMKGEPILAERGVEPEDPARHPLPCKLQRRAARIAARKDSVRLRRTRGFPDRLRIR